VAPRDEHSPHWTGGAAQPDGRPHLAEAHLVAGAAACLLLARPSPCVRCAPVSGPIASLSAWQHPLRHVNEEKLTYLWRAPRLDRTHASAARARSHHCASLRRPLPSPPTAPRRRPLWRLDKLMSFPYHDRMLDAPASVRPHLPFHPPFTHPHTPHPLTHHHHAWHSSDGPPPDPPPTCARASSRAPCLTWQDAPEDKLAHGLLTRCGPRLGPEQRPVASLHRRADVVAGTSTGRPSGAPSCACRHCLIRKDALLGRMPY
jgi:hypothetical protein